MRCSRVSAATVRSGASGYQQWVAFLETLSDDYPYEAKPAT
jgi:hypothetical protein